MRESSVHRLLTAVFFVVAIGQPGGAQTLAGAPELAVVGVAEVAGVVREASSGAPIVGARVSILELHREDVTHEGGDFHFSGVPDGSYTLRVIRLGYQPVSRTIRVAGGVAPAIEIAMSPSPVQLGATVVTGTAGERQAQDVISPLSVLSAAKLDRELKGTLASTIQNEPGVTMSTMGPATARPVIRGFSGDRVVVLEDGARTGDMAGTGADHALAVDPMNVRQIEIVRGPMSLLYGSSALGGVVNAIREEVPGSRFEHPMGALSVQGSSVDEGLAAGGHVAGSLGPVALRAEGSLRRAGDQRTPLGLLENTAAETYGAAVGGAYVVDRGHAGGSYRYYGNRYGVPGGFVGGHGHGVTIDMRRHMLRSEVELHPAGPFETIKVNGSYSHYDHEEREAGGSLGTWFGQDMLTTDVLLRRDGEGRMGQTAIGARWQLRSIRTGGTLRTPSTYDNTAAVFGVQEFVFDRLRLEGGARYDWAHYVPSRRTPGVFVNGEWIPTDPRTFGSVSGSLGALYEVGAGVRLGTSFSRAYRTPDFNELYSNGPHLAAHSFDVGNPRLGQETGVGVDVFARLQREHVRGEVALFTNRMRGYIFPRNTGDLGTQGNRPKFQFTGRDAAFIGAEGTIETTVLRRVVLDATVSVVDARFIGAVDSLPPDSTRGVFDPRPGSRFVPLIPPVTGRVGARYETPRYFAGAGLRLAGAQRRTGDFEEPTDGYAVLDADMGVRLLLGRRVHAVTLSVDNATNSAYRNHLSRTKEIMPEAGRNVSLLYRVMF